MPSTGQRRDLLGSANHTAERVRKMEVLRQSRTQVPRRWRPTHAETQIIAGHITMLGCWQGGGYQDEANGGGIARVSQASQVLWALLDQRGFTSPAEAQDWTLFLQRLGALSLWPGMSPLTFPDPTPAAWWEEMRPAMSFPSGTVARVGFTTGQGWSSPASKALYWAGYPAGTTWDWKYAGADLTLGYGPWPDTTTWQGYPQWGIVEWPKPPRVTGGYGYPCPPGVFMLRLPIRDDGYPEWPMVGNVSEYQVSAPGQEPPFPIYRCGNWPEYPMYNGHVYPGVPLGPFFDRWDCNLQQYQYPANTGTTGRIVVKPGFDPADLYLAVPPRQQLPNLHSTKTSWGAHPGWDAGLNWLEEVVDMILDEHPYVSQFYAEHLPIAEAWKRRREHVGWQQLRLYHWWRGRLEAKLYRDRVILRGSVWYSGGGTGQYDGHPIRDVPIFEWPVGWTAPGSVAYLFGARQWATDQTGRPIPVNISYLGGRVDYMFAQNSGYAVQNGSFTLTFANSVPIWQKPSQYIGGGGE